MGKIVFWIPLQLWPTRCLKKKIAKERAAIKNIDVWHADRAKMDARIRKRWRRMERMERCQLELKRREAGGFYLYDQFRLRG